MHKACALCRAGLRMTHRSAWIAGSPLSKVSCTLKVSALYHLSPKCSVCGLLSCSKRVARSLISIARHFMQIISLSYASMHMHPTTARVRMDVDLHPVTCIRYLAALQHPYTAVFPARQDMSG